MGIKQSWAPVKNSLLLEELGGAEPLFSFESSTVGGLLHSRLPTGLLVCVEAAQAGGVSPLI